MSGLPARQAAFHVLNAVLFKKKNLDVAFAESGVDKLESRDRGFVRLLVTTVLKHVPEMDAAIVKFLRDPIDQLKPPQLINIFRLGVAQFAFLKTPVHAAVDTSVELAVAENMKHQKNFVNAVMRRLVKTGYTHLKPRDAGKINTPEWLWEQWMRDYGVETALDIAAANLSEAPVDFTPIEDIETWAHELEAEVLPTGVSLRRKTAGFVPGLKGFEEGKWWVQNAAAAIPARLFGDVTGKTVVDLCAAPGGKAAQLATMGARVIAVDRSAPRMKRFDENMQRLGFEVEQVIADGVMWQPVEKVDAVLLDAPCTATGTIRHQPDVLHLKEIKDQEKMTALQRKLLVNAVEMLKPGGTLMYCTCSLQKAEGEDQVAWLLGQSLPIERAKIQSDDLPGIQDMITPEGDLRILPQYWPDIGGMDGFYISRIIKR